MFSKYQKRVRQVRDLCAAQNDQKAQTVTAQSSRSASVTMELDSHPANIVLDFGKHRGKRLSEVPNEYLGLLTMWSCSMGCCEDSDCEGEEECGNKVKVRRWTMTKCGAYDSRGPCQCRTCEQLAFLATKDDVTSAAREICTMKRLCCRCWSFMPPVGQARANGAGHDDWSSRFLHKSCWIQIRNGHM